MAERFDVVVIGLGPAGSMAALAAARAGARVLAVERKRRVGALPHCAEFVPQALALELEMPGRSRVQAVAGMESRLGGESRFLAGPGWILDRQVFDHALAQRAAAAGAELWAGCAFAGRDEGRLVLRAGGRPREVLAGAVVAADGAASPCARAFGLGGQAALPGVQMEVPLARPLEHTVVFLDPAFRGGYAWLFPKGPAANLGLGCAAGARPRTLLEDLRAELLARGVIAPGVLARAGGAICVAGPRPPAARGLILCGDAAGLTHPLTGAGIPQALHSGLAAGRAAAALAGGDAAAGEDYAHDIALRYGRYLARGLKARAELEAGWSGDFAGLMARTWPGWRHGD